MIRQARAEDVKEIKRLAESLRFDPENPEPATLVTVLKDEEYLARIRDSPYVYVSVDGQGVNGFLISEDDRLIDRLREYGQFHHESIMPVLAKKARPFVYGEVIGVRKDVQESGVGNAMVDRWLEDVLRDGIKGMYVMIRHEPCKNVRSVKFSMRYGLTFTGEEVENGGCIFGVYGRTFS